jgi:hypothetical protein
VEVKNDTGNPLPVAFPDTPTVNIGTIPEVEVKNDAGNPLAVSVSNTPTVNVAASQKIGPDGFVYGASYKAESLLAANTPEAIFTAAANVNGAVVWDAGFVHSATSGSNGAGFVAKATAPTTIVDGDVVLSSDYLAIGGTECFAGSLKRPVRIPAGKGLYFINEVAATRSHRRCLYTLL